MDKNKLKRYFKYTGGPQIYWYYYRQLVAGSTSLVSSFLWTTAKMQA
jgi:hypothetical protein